VLVTKAIKENKVIFFMESPFGGIIGVSLYFFVKYYITID